MFAAAVRGCEKYFLCLWFPYLVAQGQSLWEKTDVSQKYLDFSHLMHFVEQEAPWKGKVNNERT